MRRWCLAWLTVLALVAACSRQGEAPPGFVASDVTGATFGRDFALPDAGGTVRRLADFRGKVVLVFFGYTQCPDVCPTELARLAELRGRLGADAERVQGVFITLDPARDTPAVIGEYVRAFDPTFIGLRGDAEAAAATAREFRVFYQQVPGSAPDRYALNHSTHIYAFDPAGRLRLLMQSSAGVEAMVGDVRTLLAGH